MSLLQFQCYRIFQRRKLKGWTFQDSRTDFPEKVSKKSQLSIANFKCAFQNSNLFFCTGQFWHAWSDTSTNRNLAGCLFQSTPGLFTEAFPQSAKKMVIIWTINNKADVTCHLPARRMSTHCATCVSTSLHLMIAFFASMHSMPRNVIWAWNVWKRKLGNFDTKPGTI